METPEIGSVTATALRKGKSKSCGKCNQFEMIGKTYSRLTVLSINKEVTQAKHNKNDFDTYFNCQCSCKNKNLVVARGSSLRNGYIHSCGCYKSEKTREFLVKNLIGQEFGYLKVLSLVDKEPGKLVTWHCLCQNCGQECDVTTDHLTSGNTRSCDCLKKSIGELNIQSILNSNNIVYQAEKQFKDLFGINNGKLRYDFYLPDYNRLIEFDGEQHFKCNNSGWNTKEHLNKVQFHDKIKNEYAFSHKIDIVRIPYWEKDKITLDMLLGEQYLLKRGENTIDND